MKLLLFAVLGSLASCAARSLPEQLEDACEARVCPSDPPDSIDCMPIVPSEWEPICARSCREFLQSDCQIPFSD